MDQVWPPFCQIYYDFQDMNDSGQKFSLGWAHFGMEMMARVSMSDNLYLIQTVSSPKQY
jgi:hypothetical protein